MPRQCLNLVVNLCRESCATDEERLRPGLGALLEPLIGRLAVQATVGSMVVVEVLPLPQLVDGTPVVGPLDLAPVA
jgi:hypothetical protein